MTTHREVLRQDVELSLRKASDQQLIKVMRFIDRLPSRHAVEDIVDRVRGRLAIVRPARPLTVGRVLTLPLEDLLVEPALEASSPWVVPRSLLSAIHRIILRSLPEPLHEELTVQARDKTMDDRDTVLDMGEALWPAGAAALRRFLTHEAGEEAIQGWSEQHRNRLAGIALLLEHAAEIVNLVDQLPPKPMGELTDNEQAAALALLSAMRGISETLFRYCYAMLMRRSSHPSQIFALVIDHDFDISTDRRDRILAEAARECMHEIDAMHDDVDVLGRQSVASAAETTLRLAALIESLEKAPAAVRIDTRRLSQTKDKASKTIIRTLEASLGGEMRRTIEDLASKPDATDEEVAAAETIARSTRKIEIAGSRLGITRSMESVLGREVGGYRDLIVDKLRNLPRTKNATIADIMDELRLIEIVFGPDVVIQIVEDLQS